jgi:Tfp pilus assembly protein PilN
MRALAIDFQRRRRAHPLGWLVLLAGVASLAFALHAGRTLEQEKLAQQQRLARASARLAAVPRSAPPDARADASLASARQALDKAKLPWNELFAGLEAAHGIDVALLSVSPEVTRRQVRIHAEARDFAAMLAYHRQLQQQPGLGQVVLVDHVIVKDVPETPVRFQILAAWGTSNGQP